MKPPSQRPATPGRLPSPAPSTLADLPAAGLIAISGPSGAGKSTLLRMLAGIETPPPGFRSLPQMTAEGCDWISTDIYVPAGTLAEAIAWNRGSHERGAAAGERPSTSGLLDERLLPGGLDARIAEGGDNLSGGQRMRIGIARIMLSGGVVLADEPTAKLDPQTAKLVRQVLTEIAKRRLVIVATHDERLIEAASRHHVLRSAVPGRTGGCGMSLHAITPIRRRSCAVPARCRARSPWRLAILLAVAASASGILLTGISVWFLGAVALAGLGPAALAFNFHIPAALRPAVRAEQDARQIWRTCRRDIAPRCSTRCKRRAQLFAAMAQAPSTRAAGWQLGNQDRLSDYMEDVEDVDYARLRVGMPAAILMAGIAALAAATAWLTPLALVPIALLSLAMTLTLRRLLPLVDQQWAAVRSSQRAAGRLLGTALAAAVPLQAERAFPDILATVFGDFSKAEAGRLPSVARLPCSTCWPG